MIRRHPLLSGLALVYAGGLAWVTLSPLPFGASRDTLLSSVSRALHRSPQTAWVSDSTLLFAANLVLFVPLGLLFVLMFGRHRWLSGVFIGGLVSCWIALAQTVWLPDRPVPMFVLAHASGTVVGLGIGVLVVAMARRPQAGSARPVQALTPVSQPSRSDS